MQIYIDGDKYYESMGGKEIDNALALRMIKSGADLFVMEAGNPVQILNKYKLIDMLDCVNHLIKQAKITMDSTNNIPRELCWEAFDKLGIMLRDMGVKNEFDEF